MPRKGDFLDPVQIGLFCGSMLDEPQLAFLYGLAVMAPDGPSIEIGVAAGGSLCCWAQGRWGRGPVYAADPFEGKRWAKLRSTYEQNIETWLDNTAILVSGPLLKPFLQDVSFCFVDGRHDIAGMSLDIQWAKKIRPGGVIAFHDYMVVKESCAVEQVVDAWQKEAQWQPLGIVGSVVAFRR